MAVAKKDANRVPTLIGVSSADGSTPIRVKVDPDTNRLYVDVALSGVTDLTGVTDGEAVNAADKGVLLMGTDGSNYQVVAADSSGNLQVDVLNTSIAVTGTFWQVTQPVSIAGTVGVDVADEATRLLGVVYGSQGAQLQQKVTTNDLIVTLDSESVAVTGTFWQATQPVSATDLDIRDLTSVSDSVQALGNVAHDAADSGNSIKIGGRADTTFQTTVADADRVDALFDVYGQLRTRVDHANNWSYHSNGSAALTDAAVQAAPGVGLSVYITDIIFSTGAATACNIFFEEGAKTILGPYYIEAIAGRGLALHFTTPKKCTANTALTVTTSAAIANGLDVLGFISP